MPPLKLLILNPNSSTSMTDSLHAPIESLNYNNTKYTYTTSPPPAPLSINSPADALASATAALPSLISLLPAHDGVLIACFSPHPLVPWLKAHKHSPPVVGILEASVWAARALVRERVVGGWRGDGVKNDDEKEEKEEEEEEEGERFGVVSTADEWAAPLTGYISEQVLGRDVSERVFAGVETCGISAGELHVAPAAEVERRVKEAVGRLLARGKRGGGKVGVVVLGCAGMAGMEGWVREVAGEGLRVVDGVRAGVGVLQELGRGGF